MLSSIGRQIDRLADADGLDQLVGAAARLARARKVYCLGLRASHSAAWHLHYVLTLIGDRSILVDGIAGTGPDALANAAPQDVLLVASVLPYTRRAVEIAEYAAGCGVPVVAITDSKVAPVAQIAEHVILAPTDSPSFFHAMSPAFVVAEVLGAIVAGQRGNDALAALHRTDAHLAALDTHLNPRPAKRAIPAGT
jgi:DNA-binding MurR/RpiR family transcriptional regulator